jgi:hypothetical protein
MISAVDFPNVLQNLGAAILNSLAPPSEFHVHEI